MTWLGRSAAFVAVLRAQPFHWSKMVTLVLLRQPIGLRAWTSLVTSNGGPKLALFGLRPHGLGFNVGLGGALVVLAVICTALYPHHRRLLINGCSPLIPTINWRHKL